jgi:hypothetical protein
LAGIEAVEADAGEAAANRSGKDIAQTVLIAKFFIFGWFFASNYLNI